LLLEIFWAMIEKFGHQLGQQKNNWWNVLVAKSSKQFFWAMDNDWIPTIDLEIDFLNFFAQKHFIIIQKEIYDPSNFFGLPTWNFSVVARIWWLNNMIFSRP
jgi:hypothetical protein